MPRNTKASRILNDAAMRLEAARTRRHTAQSQLNSAIATHDALQEAYDALAKELAPTPRKKAASKPATAQKEPASNDPVPEGLCSYKYSDGSVCLAPASNAIHDEAFGYAGYHPFSLVAPAVAPKPSRKSKSTKASESSIPSSETPLTVVGDAALAVSAGD